MRWKPPPSVVHAIADRLLGSLHFHVVGQERLRRAMAMSPRTSVIFALWHQHLLLILGKHRRQRVAALTSLSHDGTIMADLIERFGLRAVRGSSSKGGLRAAREIIAAVEDGWHAAITVDGPRGPFKEVKAGPFEIARRSGAAIVPVVARASRELCFKRSWDRFRCPIPGAQVALVYGEPMVVPTEYPTPTELFARRVELAQRLHDAEATALRSLGRRVEGPPGHCLVWMDGPRRNESDAR